MTYTMRVYKEGREVIGKKVEKGGRQDDTENQAEAGRQDSQGGL